MTSWIDKPDRLKIDAIWLDEDRVRILANDRDAWEGDCIVLDLLRQLDELGRIAFWEYDDEQEYLDRHKEIDNRRKLLVGI